MRARRTHCLVLVVLYHSVSVPSSFGQESTQAQDLATLRRVLDTPADRLDLARAKLTIDQMIDQTIDVDKEIRRINRMAESVKSMMPAGASDLQKVAALRVYLHKPGPWNGYRAFSYDFGDRLGKTVTHKLLTVYIRTRKGNCVSMPLLFVILGRETRAYNHCEHRATTRAREVSPADRQMDQHRGDERRRFRQGLLGSAWPPNDSRSTTVRHISTPTNEARNRRRNALNADGALRESGMA